MIAFLNHPLFAVHPHGSAWLDGDSLAEVPGGVILNVPDGSLLDPVDPPWTPGVPATVSCQPTGKLEPRAVGTAGAYEVARLPASQAELMYTSNGKIWNLPIMVTP